MRGAWLGLLLCLIYLDSAAEEPADKTASTLPDVVLVTIDTLRADHLHCYGDDGVQTPALDGLAKDGIRFAKAFTPSPITNSSHITILTGLLPSSHGVTDFAVPLAASHATWAELLKLHGYHTAAFIGAVILDSNGLAPGIDRGFDFYDNFPHHAAGKSRWGRLERRGMDVVQRAETWLEANPDGPHFLWVHLYDPHDPYEPPSPYSQEYKDRLYDGEIAYADSALGELLKYLKRKGWYDAAAVIVVGDHGEGLGEHHEQTHGTFLYDATTHVPLIMKLPGGQDGGKTVEAQVQTTDLLPTALELLHLPVPLGLDGQPLQGTFSGAAAAEQPVLGETDYPLHFGWAPLQSVRAHEFKLIEAPRPELYDLSVDAGENRNLYESLDPRVKVIREALLELRAKSLPLLPPESLSLADPKDKIEEQNLLHIAMAAEEDLRADDARRALEKVVLMDASSWTALGQLAGLEERAGEYAKAAAHLKTARRLRPQEASFAYRQGEVLEKSGDLTGAREALEASFRLSPQQLAARVLLGRICIRQKDFAAAADQFDAALLLEPEAVEAKLGIAEAEIGQRNFVEAAEQLRSLSTAEPANPEVLELLARACRGLHKTSEAEMLEQRAKALRGGPER